MSEVQDLRQRRRRRAGVIGSVAGVVAAGLAAGVAIERVLVRRSRHQSDDPHAHEPFGRLPYDESMRVTTRDGVALHVEVVDPTDGVELDATFAAAVAADPPRPEPTVVFVHGFCLHMGAFHFQRRALTRRGDWRAVFYDQPGHGRSEHLPHGEYELSALGEALRAVIEATTPAGPVVLVGHSMGGMTILALAELFPELFAERVSGVALIATSAGRMQTSTTGLPEIVAKVGWGLVPLVSGTTRLTGSMIDRARRASSDLAWLLTRKYGFGDSNPSAALVSYVEQMNSATTFETVARYLRTLQSHDRYPALAALRDKPVLLICGDRDPITPLAHSEEIKSHLPDAELVVIPDSGHVVMLEHADEVNRALFAFLEKLE